MGESLPCVTISPMKLIAFTLLTLSGLAAGLVIGLASMPKFQEFRQNHLVSNAIGGAVAGMAMGGIAAWVIGGTSKKD